MLHSCHREVTNLVRGDRPQRHLHIKNGQLVTVCSLRPHHLCHLLGAGLNQDQDQDQGLGGDYLCGHLPYQLYFHGRAYILNGGVSSTSKAS